MDKEVILAKSGFFFRQGNLPLGDIEDLTSCFFASVDQEIPNWLRLYPWGRLELHLG